jgi:hypothetical protein
MSNREGSDTTIYAMLPVHSASSSISNLCRELIACLKLEENGGKMNTHTLFIARGDSSSNTFKLARFRLFFPFFSFKKDKFLNF